MKRILVRAPQWLGDAVVATAFVERLRRRDPGARLSVACMPALRELFATQPGVDAVLELPYRAGGSVTTTAAAWRAEAFDEIYVLPRSFRTALEPFLARVPSRVGFGGDLRRFLFTRAVPYDATLSYPHRILALIGEQSLPTAEIRYHFPSTPPAPGAFSPDPSALPRPILGVAPVSVAPARTWEPERFAETANRFIQDNGGSVVLFGAPNEAERVGRVAAALRGPSLNTAGRLSLPELGWMIGRCDVFLANDSGLMHVAAALARPSVIVFGPSDPAVALPRTGRFLAVQNADVPCVPCLRNECPRFGRFHKECLRTVAPAAVLAALGEVRRGSA